MFYEGSNPSTPASGVRTHFAFGLFFFFKYCKDMLILIIYFEHVKHVWRTKKISPKKVRDFGFFSFFKRIFR